MMVVVTVFPVVIIVVFVAPVAFVEAPTLVVVVVMGVVPVSTGVGRLIPIAGVPAVSTLPGLVEAIDPGKTGAGGRGARLVAHGWRGRADVDADLRGCSVGNGSEGKDTGSDERS